MKTLGPTAFISAAPTIAFGHAGHHGETGLQAALKHVAQSPHHVALLGLVAAAVIAGSVLLSRQLRERNN